MTHPGHSLELISGDYRRFVPKLNVGDVTKRVTALRNHSTGQMQVFRDRGHGQWSECGDKSFLFTFFLVGQDIKNDKKGFSRTK